MVKFKNTPNGLPGICTRTPLLWSYGVLKGRISRQRFVELNSSNAAKLYGRCQFSLFPIKTSLSPLILSFIYSLLLFLK